MFTCISKCLNQCPRLKTTIVNIEYRLEHISNFLVLPTERGGRHRHSSVWRSRAILWRDGWTNHRPVWGHRPFFQRLLRGREWSGSHTNRHPSTSYCHDNLTNPLSCLLIELFDYLVCFELSRRITNVCLSEHLILVGGTQQLKESNIFQLRRVGSFVDWCYFAGSWRLHSQWPYCS